jgi:Txe/YoeB family toxin of Txe-Axe toxin-antitoxin module
LQKHKTHIENQRKKNKKIATIQEIKTNPFEIIKKQENPFYQNQN